MKTIVLAFAVAIASIAYAGLFDSAWLKGTTNKNPLFYLPGEEMVFTVVPQSLEGEVPEGVTRAGSGMRRRRGPS